MMQAFGLGLGLLELFEPRAPLFGPRAFGVEVERSLLLARGFAIALQHGISERKIEMRNRFVRRERNDPLKLARGFLPAPASRVNERGVVKSINYIWIDSERGFIFAHSSIRVAPVFGKRAQRQMNHS